MFRFFLRHGVNEKRERIVRVMIRQSRRNPPTIASPEIRKMKQSISLPEPNDVLYRIKRGLAGYVSYLAACEMNESFSEYLLYEPILRILTARGYVVECEVTCPGIEQPKTGDKRKLDFVARKNGLTFAVEVKWARTVKPNIDDDLMKLSAL